MPAEIRIRLADNVADLWTQYAASEGKSLPVYIAEWVTGVCRGHLYAEQFEAWERGEKVDVTRAIEAEKAGLIKQTGLGARPHQATPQAESEDDSVWSLPIDHPTRRAALRKMLEGSRTARRD
jgi:hypothetical protein